jgi:hypothetical protein
LPEAAKVAFTSTPGFFAWNRVAIASKAASCWRRPRRRRTAG